MLTKKPLFPGWKMTVDQHGLLFRLWGDACRAQGWDRLSASERDAKRKEVTARVFGPGKSWTEVNKTGECDLLFARLKFLADKLQGAQEDLDPEPGQRRRYIHRIGEQIQELESLGYSESLKTILKTRFKVIEGVRTIFDLPTRELLNMVQTLDRCIKDQL
jgi:hypothetical protein